MLAFLLLAAANSRAQDADKLYQKGVDAFNNAQMEDACEALKQADKLKPGNQQTSSYMKMACGQVKKLYDHEQQLFNQGVQLNHQGKLADARQAFQNVVQLRLKNPKYRAQAQQYLKEIEARQADEKLFQEGGRLLQQGKFSDARADFSKLAGGSGSHAADARKMLAQVDDAELKHQQESEARSKATSEKPASPPASTPASAAGDQSLRTGLQAYFNGEFDVAENSLSDYLNGNGSKRDLAFFFRGASHSARYFLSGKKDSRERDLALQDFHTLKGIAQQFQPPQNYVSPKIMALYREAVGGQSQ